MKKVLYTQILFIGICISLALFLWVGALLPAAQTVLLAK